jgi:hypothetical protein
MAEDPRDWPIRACLVSAGGARRVARLPSPVEYVTCGGMTFARDHAWNGEATTITYHQVNFWRVDLDEHVFITDQAGQEKHAA